MMFYLLRHGETDWNAAGRLQGQTDIPLNENGRTQARQAAGFIATLTITTCHASDLSRAFETARLALANHSSINHIIKNPDLRERNFGSMDGRSHDEIEQHKIDHPDFYSDQDGTGRLFPKDGEQYDIFTNRIHRVLQLATNRDNTGPVLMVTHGGVIRQIWRELLTGQTIPQPGNGHVYRLEKTPKGWVNQPVWPAQ